jgi:hypothetical protein
MFDEAMILFFVVPIMIGSYKRKRYWSLWKQKQKQKPVYLDDQLGICPLYLRARLCVKALCVCVGGGGGGCVVHWVIQYIPYRIPIKS